MNPTNPYWQAPVDYTTRHFLKPVANTLGFLFTIPWEQPVTAGNYYGQGQIFPNTRRPQIVTDSRPEYFSVADTIPTVGGRAQVDVKGPEMKFSRAKHTKYV